MSDTYINQIVELEDAFNFSLSSKTLFLKAMKAIVDWHYKRNPVYYKLCEREGFSPSLLTTQEAIFRIPFIFVTVIKKYKLLSIADKDIFLTLTSSGTGGVKSAIYLDKSSLERIKKIVKNIFSSLNLYSPDEVVNYICFTYEPEYASWIGTSFSDRMLMELTGVGEAFFALRYSNGGFYFDKSGAMKSLKRFLRLPNPVRLLGFPSFLYQFIQDIEVRLPMPESCFVITGGGWKTLADKEIPKQEFRKEIAHRLGIPVENVRDLFGFVEHGIPYVECEKGNFHIPIYSQVLARDPATLKPLPKGEVGLLHFLTPYITSMPTHSVLSSDLGSVEEGCHCGRRGTYLKFIGRGGVRKLTGCAISALEVLAKGE